MVQLWVGVLLGCGGEGDTAAPVAPARLPGPCPGHQEAGGGLTDQMDGFGSEVMLLHQIPHVRFLTSEDEDEYERVQDFTLMDANDDGFVDVLTLRSDHYKDIQVFYGPIGPRECDLMPGDGTFILHHVEGAAWLDSPGDATGDGVEDLIIYNRLIPGPLQTPMDQLDYYGTPEYGEGELLPAGDHDLDGVADLLWYVTGGTTHLMHGPSPADVGEPFFVAPEGAYFARPVVLGDVSGDGVPDYASFGNLDNASAEQVWIMSEVPSAPTPIVDSALVIRPQVDAWTGGISQGVRPAGDLNGDGHADVFVEHSYAKVFFGPFAATGTVDLNEPQFTASIGASVLEARGDVDGGGFDDVSIAELWYGENLCPMGDALLCSPGAIHLVAGPREGVLDEADTLQGDRSWGSIGWTTVGDLDMDDDGRKDLVVSNGPMVYILFGV